MYSKANGTQTTRRGRGQGEKRRGHCTMVQGAKLREQKLNKAQQMICKKKMKKKIKTNKKFKASKLKTPHT